MGTSTWEDLRDKNSTNFENTASDPPRSFCDLHSNLTFLLYKSTSNKFNYSLWKIITISYKTHWHSELQCFKKCPTFTFDPSVHHINIKVMTKMQLPLLFLHTNIKWENKRAMETFTMTSWHYWISNNLTFC